jgi:DNA-binding transcriptional LysR family regulator
MVSGPSIPSLRLHSGTGNNLNFHQLYIFYAVASHHSFSRAAEALEISQPAVSIQIQELERNIGSTLFHRRTRDLRITDVGEVVLAYAQQIFSLSSKLLNAIDELQGLQSGHLTLGASTTPGEFVLPVGVGRFRQLYPGVQVEMFIGNSRAITQRMLNQEIDLGMVGSRPTAHANDLEIIEYLNDEIVLVAAPDHPLSQSQRVTLQQVVDAGLIVREVGSATRESAEQYLHDQGITAKAALELGSNQAVKQAAAAGGGIGVISKLGVAAEVKSEMLKVLNVQGWNCRRNLYLIYPKNRYLSPTQTAFLQFLQSEQLVPDA